MESLYLLIPLSILLTFVIGIIFLWATRSGQFDDLDSPAQRILLDDDSIKHPERPTGTDSGEGID
jgi:cbb3-type cytochrome oxidase maturation protein